MDSIDVLTASHISLRVKQTVLELLHANPQVAASALILTPRSSNDDLNGSQHAAGGGTDFTYEEAEDHLFEDGSMTFGVYDYFSNEGMHYTGHYYNGSDQKFAAIVINPPAYAATHSC